MERRTFLTTLMASSTIPALPLFAAPKGGIIDLRFYYLRNTPEQQMQRTSQFLEKHALPALKRAGMGSLGVFQNLIAPNGPFLMTALSHPSLAAVEQAEEKVAADTEYMKALEEFNAVPGLAYMSYERTLLRAHDSMPGIEIPPAAKTPRVFELRVYQSNNSSTLRRKIKQMEEGVYPLFKKLGMRPVFSGAAIAGRDLPNMTYLLGYDDLAHREKAWAAFLADPEWVKLRSAPGNSNAEILSNITSILLSPTPFSAIK